MRKSSYLLVAAVMAVLLLAGLIGCAQPAPSPKPTPAPAPSPAPSPTASPKPSPSPTPSLAPAPPAAALDKDISIGTKMMPSTTYIFGASVSQALNKFTKNFTSRVMPAGSENVFPEGFQKGDLDLGIMETPASFQSANGILAWKEPMPVRMIGYGPPSYYGVIVNPKAGIKTPADLKGKKWMVIRPGSQLLKDMAEATLHGYGLTDKDVSVLSHSSVKEFSDALKEGRMDAIGWPYYPKTPWLEELALLGKGVPLSDTEEGLKKILAKYPYFVRQTLPANMYKGQDKEVVTFGATSNLVARATLSTDQVYEITKILFDNFAEWKSYYPEDIQYYALPGSLALSRVTVPFHDGAIKYYKEKGFWTPEHDAKQKALLEAIPKKK